MDEKSRSTRSWSSPPLIGPSPSSSIAPDQNTRPATAARRSTVRSVSGSRSILAEIIAWTVCGIPSDWPPDSSSMRTVSSMKSGFPSVVARTVSRSSFVSSADSPATSASRSCALSASGSASSSIEVERTLPPPHAGRSSSRSLRARQRIRSGTSLTPLARCSIRSSIGSSARWMSSNTSTSGCRSASSVAHVCAAQAISDADRSPAPTASSTPDASASRSATASSPQQFRSFSLAASTVSSSVMPAATFTISAIAQYVTPSP